MRRNISRDGAHVRSVESLRTLRHVEFDLLPFGQRAETVRLNGRLMAEDITAAFLCDEAVALRIVEPLDDTGCQNALLFFVVPTGARTPSDICGGLRLFSLWGAVARVSTQAAARPISPFTDRPCKRSVAEGLQQVAKARATNRKLFFLRTVMVLFAGARGDSLPDLNCLRCKVVVLRRRDGIGRAAMRSHVNLTWANGRQVSATDRLVCATCGGELSLDPIPAEVPPTPDSVLESPSTSRDRPGES